MTAYLPALPNLYPNPTGLSLGPVSHRNTCAPSCPLFPEPPDPAGSSSVAGPGRGRPSAHPLQLGTSQQDAPSAAGLAKGQGAIHMQLVPHSLSKGCSPVDSRWLARTQSHPTQAVCPQQGGRHAPDPTPPARPQVYTQARPQRHTDRAPCSIWDGPHLPQKLGCRGLRALATRPALDGQHQPDRAKATRSWAP